jgi:hypothetical protein
MFGKLLNQLLGKEEETNNTPAPQPVNPEPQPQRQPISYDPETQHGTHYSVEDFDVEVARLSEDWIAQEIADGETMSEDDKRNIYYNYRQQVYLDWNKCDSDQYILFEHANSLKYLGVQTSGFVKVDDNNPFLAPVHGISLKDYTAMCLKISGGVDHTQVCKAMGLEAVIWDELNTIWPQRMAEDTSFTVTTLFGQYYAENEPHPKLQHLQAEISAAGAGNLERLKTDRYFYEELAGARQAAYEYGLDGAQWILETYGINLADFQSVAMQYMTAQNQGWNSEDILHYNDYQQQKQKEYAKKFAAEQGGNVADDIEF